MPSEVFVNYTLTGTICFYEMMPRTI